MSELSDLFSSFYDEIDMDYTAMNCVPMTTDIPKKGEEAEPLKVFKINDIKERRCLKCWKEFDSIGKGNRICGKCAVRNTHVGATGVLTTGD